MVTIPRCASRALMLFWLLAAPWGAGCTEGARESDSTPVGSTPSALGRSKAALAAGSDREDQARGDGGSASSTASTAPVVFLPPLVRGHGDDGHDDIGDETEKRDGGPYATGLAPYLTFQIDDQPAGL